MTHDGWDNDPKRISHVHTCVARLNDGMLIWAAVDEPHARNVLGVQLYALEALASCYRRMAREAGTSHAEVEEMRADASRLGKAWFDDVPMDLINSLRKAAAQRAAAADPTARSDDAFTAEQRAAAERSTSEAISRALKKD